MLTLMLKSGREKSLLRYHPWIFSGAVADIHGQPAAGETIRICTSRGQPLAVGAYSPQSQIVARVWSFDPTGEPDAAWFQRQLARALATRRAYLAATPGTAYRLVNAESDGLPGVIIDRYGDFLVGQFLSAGAAYWKTTITQELMTLLSPAGIYERSDSDARAKEGLPVQIGVLAGETPPPTIEIQEGALRFLVDVQQGHKTGFYLDQRENRAALAEYVAGAEVLNCFAYTGGFGVAALHYGAAQVTNIDTSAAALELAQQHAVLNGLDEARAEYLAADVFQVLRRYRDAGRQFDVIVLDPPKFAESRNALPGACRGYKDINLLALKLLRPCGILCTFSCSGLLSPELFQKIVADAAVDAQRDARLLRRLAQAPDHPVALNFPEGHYLKGLICQVW